MDWNKIGADRLAYAVARLIQRRVLDSRSEAGDALLDYLGIGQPGEPQDVPTWMEGYEASQNAEAHGRAVARTVQPLVGSSEVPK
jgi:hypothetical protein